MDCDQLVPDLVDCDQLTQDFTAGASGQQSSGRVPRGVGCLLLLLLLHVGQCVGCLGLGESLRSMKFPRPREEGRIIRDAMGYKLRDACQTKTFLHCTDLNFRLP